MSDPRRIAVLTGKRGGFGALIPFFVRADADPAVDLRVVATDMHVSGNFGHTLSEVRKWVSKVTTVPMDQTGSSPVARAEALGRALTGIARALDELKPDVFVVLGDRGETLAAVTAAVHLGIPIAHIQGGDVSGNVDEVMRHAITKMAHIHFPSTEESGARIAKMGEEPWRIHVVGDPHVDRIVAGEFAAGADVRARYGIALTEPFLLVLYHPETLGHHQESGPAMQAIMDAVIEKGLRTLVVYPCSDHGYEGIVQVIERVSGQPGISVHKNIEALDFWGLQAQAAAFIGNSSAGLIEAPYFNLPVVNVGRRQEGRTRWMNVVDCATTPEALRTSLATALAPAFRDRLASQSVRPFGDGRSCERMLDILKSVPLDERLKNKRMAY